MFARIHLAVALGFLAAILSSKVHGAAAASDGASPAEVLAAKGLSKFGAYYVLEPDLKLGDWLRVTQAAERKYTDAKKRYAALQNQSRQVNDLLQNLNAQNETQTNILEHISKSANGTYNHQVDVVNAIRQKLRDCIKIAEETEKAVQATPEPTNDQYVAMVVKLSNMMELVSRRYEELAADNQVKSALQRLNQTARPPVKLGPSPRFVEQLPQVRRLRATVASAEVRLDSIDGTPEVPTTLNGAVKEDMVLDSTAPYMCITAALAEKLGLQPEASDKLVRVTAGAGRTADAHLMTLKSVQVGEFTVENVPCAVEPASMKESKNLLGASFLRHFVYRMDLASGALRISQIDARPAAGSASSGSSAADLPPVPTLN